MRKKIFSIWSVLLLLLVSISILVPGCGPTEGTIVVAATLDGSAWPSSGTGAVQYTLTGPAAAAPIIINGTAVPTPHVGVSEGSWTCAYVSGGPGTFVNITPSATQTLAAGSIMTFTLNFVTTPPMTLDHFKCYRFHIPSVNPQSSYYVGQNVELEDQFVSVQAKVEYAEYFCNPAKKTYDGEVTEISNTDHHLTLYGISGVTTQDQKWVVDVNNQFGEQTLHVSGPTMLAVPTQKEGHDEPEGLDHFLLYWVYGGQDLNVVVQLEDQFNLEPDVVVYRPVAFANPVQKTIAGTNDVILIQNPNEHLVFYEIIEDETFQTDVNITNQFHTVTVSMPQWTRYINMLAVPSQKISYGPPPSLDHFKFYEAEGPSLDVVLPKVGDQFYTGIEEVEVQSPRYFGNPVAKTYDGTVTEIGDSDHHLTLYDITTPTVQNWVVEVDNQFGKQELTVSGPVMLAVPTQKDEHGPPVWLDHFLLYKVTNGVDLQVTVDLEDQWHKESDVEVYRPVYFANPAGKIPPNVDWSPGMALYIENPDEHLVLYEIAGEPLPTDYLPIVNQFGEQTLSVYEPELLAVPSEKISFEEGEPEEPMLDHFKFYEVVRGSDADVLLPKVGDQFYTGVEEVEVDSLRYFGNPVAKTYDGEVIEIGDSDHHLALYDITTPTIQNWVVEVDNQFGLQELTVYGPVMLAVPTQKEEHDWPVGLDHFLLYKVIEGEDVQKVVDLEDQWHLESDVAVHRPVYFANPAGKLHPYVDWSPDDPLIIENPDEHLVFYEIVGEPYQGNVGILNQLFREPEMETISVSAPTLLAVPSEKISFEEGEPEELMLDHFLSYWVIESIAPEAHVYLEDQFCTVEAIVGPPRWFCNPVEKRYEVVTPILDPDHHLTVYQLSTKEEPQHWVVNVNNQFGTQELIVYGPVALAVPTQKLEPGDHEPPVGLDHFLLYEVIEGPYFDNLVVGLDDEFHDIAEGSMVATRYFANPVQKTDDTGLETEIVNTQAHLVFYEVIAGQYSYRGIVIANQFEQQTFDLGDPGFLVVPSQKISWEEEQPQ